MHLPDKWHISPPLPPVERCETQCSIDYDKDIENQTSNVGDERTWWELVWIVWKRLFSLWAKIEAPTLGKSTSDTTIISIDQSGFDSQISGPTIRTPSQTSTNESVVASHARPSSVESTSAANDGDLSDTRPSSPSSREIHHPPTPPPMPASPGPSAADLEEMYLLFQNMKTGRFQRESAKIPDSSEVPAGESRTNTTVAPTDESSHTALPPPETDEPTSNNVETEKLVDSTQSYSDESDPEGAWFAKNYTDWWAQNQLTGQSQPTGQVRSIGQVRRESRTIPQFSL